MYKVRNLKIPIQLTRSNQLLTIWFLLLYVCMCTRLLTRSKGLTVTSYFYLVFIVDIFTCEY